MFIILLKFSDNKDKAGQYLKAHKAWIKTGFDDEVFFLVGSLKTHAGGGIIAHNTSMENLQNRVNEDPFVAENIVTAEIIEIEANKVDERLDFLN